MCQELAGETVSLKDIIRARQRRKRELQRQVRARQSLIDQLLAVSVPSVATREALPPVPPSPVSPPHVALKRYHND